MDLDGKIAPQYFSIMAQLLGTVIGLAIVVFEIVGLVVGFKAGVGTGILALFLPPYAWWLGFECLFL